MFIFPKKYDVIVVGAGHAGIEAALASARMGSETLLLTMNVDTIGQMSCNPAIGGLGKGHLVREIDALGGEMAVATDHTGIQFRMLNRSKGPAVWSPRAQCDKKAYQFKQKWVCERQSRLDVKQAQSSEVLTRSSTAYGISTDQGVLYLSNCVIVTTGTFLRGLMHFGDCRKSGGRAGEPAAMDLSRSLMAAGIEMGRLKTGTPPRLVRQSIDFSRTAVQNGDNPVPRFSFWSKEMFHVEHAPDLWPRVTEMTVLDRTGRQLPCFLTRTTAKTEAVVLNNLKRSAVYGGAVEGTGPRYCPSIEDKFVRFPEKTSHQIFLEPEGAWSDEVYVNGLSTSFPVDVQVELVRSIVGCEKAEILRPAYAVEYDFAFPSQLMPSLETRCVRNLFLAGQINGTSGYEEAAAQGLMAGINATRRVRGLDPVVLRRDQAYIGVLIDDLITKGTTEPYRMFTSKAEYRLLLRQDNADLRLCDIGDEIGLLPEARYRQFAVKREAIQSELARIQDTRFGSHTLAEILRRPEISYESMPNRADNLPPDVARQVELIVKYEGYVKRQNSHIESFKRMEDQRIPEFCDYGLTPGLRTEARQKLRQFRPATLGQASRIPGVSPADISCLIIWIRKHTDYKDRPPSRDSNSVSEAAEPGDEQ